MRAAVLLLASACREPHGVPDADDQPPADAFVDKAAPCVGTFGADLADGFGRFDGIVVAVVPPGHPSCPLPNSTHMILEVSQGGQVYRMVAAMVSSSGNPTMALAERDAPLVGDAWSEGWHVPTTLDYVTDLGLHRLDFMPLPKAQLVDAVTAHIELGSHISVYATVEGQPDSAHLVHRNPTAHDGAIVVDADTNPHYLMFRFDDQLF